MLKFSSDQFIMSWSVLLLIFLVKLVQHYSFFKIMLEMEFSLLIIILFLPSALILSPMAVVLTFFMSKSCMALIALVKNIRFQGSDKIQ
uniref:NADH dehydrogenase subunit 4L n=1 Tax=Bryozoa sp. TaxID=2813608 RepID=A0AAU8L1A2_9BILA